MSIFLNNSEISSIKLGDTSVSKMFLGNEQVFPAPSPTPTPTLEVCPNSTSSVKMTGWVAGDRILSPIGYAPYGRETYIYGDEAVRYETGVWLYTNQGGELARAYSYADWPWLVDWPSPYAAEKVRQDGTACNSPSSTPTPTPTPTPIPQWDSFVAATPAGTNVAINVPPQTEGSLAFSATFQEVTIPGTTNFYEFTSTTNGVPGFKGIQIDTTAVFIGDIYFSFVLPQEISLVDFQNLSITNAIDDTNVTESRDYASRIIQGKISYTQNQNLSTIQAGPTTVGRLVVNGPADCIGQTDDLGNPKDSYCAQWRWHLGFIGDYERSCMYSCGGYGNDRDGNNNCECKCPNKMNVCFDPTWRAGSGRPLTWNCIACAPGKIFWPSGQKTSTGCDCRCLHTCSSNQIQDDACDCRCKAGYAKCGQRTINGQNYAYINEKCCPPGWTCAGIPAGQTEGECCPSNKAPCDGICCDVGHPCINGKCCDPNKVCGGTQCCKSNEVCINGSCCPTSRIFENLGVPDCCSVGYVVDVTGASCIDDLRPHCCVNNDPEHFWAFGCDMIIPFEDCNDSYPSQGEPGAFWTDSCDNTFCPELEERGINTGGGIKFCVDIVGISGNTYHLDATSGQEGFIEAYGNAAFNSPIIFKIYKRCNRWRIFAAGYDVYRGPGGVLHQWLDGGDGCLPDLPPGLTIRKNYSYVRCDNGQPR